MPDYKYSRDDYYRLTNAPCLDVAMALGMEINEKGSDKKSWKMKGEQGLCIYREGNNWYRFSDGRHGFPRSSDIADEKTALLKRIDSTFLIQQNTERISNMDKFRNYEYLIGYSTKTGEEKDIPNTLEDVADYIVREGLKGDIQILTPFYEPVLNTFGFFVDRCSDPEYMEALRPILVEKQNNWEQFLDGGSESQSADEDEDEQQEM